jgi:protein-S-isoprenylcysteine O-methyltransferase Ste14
LSRLVVTGIFAAMTGATAVSVSAAAQDALSDPRARSWAVVGYTALRLAVVAAFSYFVFVRAPSRQPSRAPVALIACTIAVAAVVLLQKPAEEGSAALVVAGDLVALASCAWLLASVLTLGRCFGVLPEVRGLVREGPYRVVRHPVYLGELGAFAGLVLAAPTTWNLVVAALFAAAQAVRMRLEERALAAEFPEYAAYALATPALIPVLGVSRRPVSSLQPELSTAHVRKGSP